MWDSLHIAFQALSDDRLILFATPLFLLALWVEHRHFMALGRRAYQADDTRASLWMGVISLGVEIVPKVLTFAVIVVLAELSPLRDVVGRQPWAWALLFLLDDLTYYVLHRANHTVRLFWAGHVPHHSSQRYNFATALRQGPGERIHKYLFWLPLPLLGFDPGMILTVMALSLLYQFFLHTEWMGPWPRPLSWLLNTPSHHRVHHASNGPYLDRNHGGVLIVWDRLFGTFVAEDPAEPVRYGLTKNLARHDAPYVATHEYRAIWADVRHSRSVGEALYRIFGPPHQARYTRLEAPSNAAASTAPPAAPSV